MLTGEGFDSDQKPHANPPSWHLSLVCIYGSRAVCFNALFTRQGRKQKAEICDVAASAAPAAGGRGAECRSSGDLGAISVTDMSGSQPITLSCC